MAINRRQPAGFKEFKIHGPKERLIKAPDFTDAFVRRTIEGRMATMASKQPDPHKESWYQARIIRWLKDNYPDAFVWKAQAGPYCRQGIPDICAIIDGHFFGFEVKRPEVGRLSKIQEQTIKEINAAGGTAAVVSYPDQVKETIEQWQSTQRKLKPQSKPSSW